MVVGIGNDERRKVEKIIRNSKQKENVQQDSLELQSFFARLVFLYNTFLKRYKACSSSNVLAAMNRIYSFSK